MFPLTAGAAVDVETGGDLESKDGVGGAAVFRLSGVEAGYLVVVDGVVMLKLVTFGD